MTSISGLLASARASSHTCTWSPTLQEGFGCRVAIWVTSIARPALRAISSALRCRTLKVPPPTVPRPHIPTLTGFKPSPHVSLCCNNCVDQPISDELLLIGNGLLRQCLCRLVAG